MISNLPLAVKVPELTIYPHAVRIRPLGTAAVKSPSVVSLANLRSNPDADGTIKGFSARSLARLRQALCVSQPIEEACCYGVCLTIPWGKPGRPGCPGQDVASEVWDDFRAHLDRLVTFLRLASIYRVELQRRSTTHWHLVVWLPVSLDLSELLARYSDIVCSKAWCKLPCANSLAPRVRRKNGHAMLDVSDDDVPRTVRDAHMTALLLLRFAWMRACAVVHAKHKEAAPVLSWDYCVNAIPCRDMSSAYSYIASHSTKHKQEQLGYKGKQWGYIGRKHLKEVDGETIQGFETDLCKHRRAVGFRLIRKWIERNRSASLARLVKPRRRVTDDDIIIYSGLCVRNCGYLNLFGVPPSVILQALDMGAVSPCRLARGVIK